MTSPHSVNVPSIRFKGFTDVWEECKLEEICNYCASSLSAKHINNEGIYDLYDANTIIGKTNTDCMKEDYITIIKDGAGVGRTRLLPKGSMFLGTMGAITPRNSNLDFLYQLVSNANLGSLYTGSTIPHIYFKDYGKNTYHVPHIVEQEQIGAFFYNIDHYITFYRYKYDKLQNIKKSMLEKMFPKNGSNIPEIRFAGFTDAWEQRKLSELATMHARIGWQNLRTSEFLDSGDYMLITGTDFNDGAINYSTCHFVERERYEQDKHIQIKNGSILITKDGTLGKVAYVQGLSMPATLNAGVFNVEIRDETEVDNKYLFQYLKAPFLMDYVDKKATGGTIKHLNQNILVDFPVLLPSKAEQKAIGVYFERLDNLITLHQRKLEKLQNIKKMMLEKMFV